MFSSHHFEMKRDRLEFSYQSLLFPFPSLPPSLLSILSEDNALFFCFFFCLPPVMARTDSDRIPLHCKYSTHCLNYSPPFFLHRQEPVPVPGLGKPSPTPEPFHCSPLQAAQSLHTRDLSFSREGEEGISRECEAKMNRVQPTQ